MVSIFARLLLSIRHTTGISTMKIFKFGGASVNSVERIQNVAAILKSCSKEPLVVIISAIGKTTNALEKVTEAFFRGEKEQALELFHTIKQQHLTTAKYLLVKNYNACYSQLNDFFTEVEWLLHDKPLRTYDYYYDQVVCVGELLSTCIVSHYLNEAGVNNQWLDIRDILRTDDNFRDANVDWKYTEERIKMAVGGVTGEQPVNGHRSPVIYLTQGFIGATDENESTTLGREGSDYTAAIFANLLDAESLTIWKDVEGVMSADPKQFPEATFLSDLSYNEVIEMAYYGAQVIHPKTIKPLQNKNIPLHVKCFLDPDAPGTTISNKKIKNLPPIVVIKENQVLVHLHSQDFSFVGEKPMSQLYEMFGKLKFKPNLVQSGAISVQLCVDEHPEKIDHLAAVASSVFDVALERGLTLLTIRHFNRDLLRKMTEAKEILLQQETKETVQVVYR
jgi:aspartate kinase